ncbi:formimidoylglutamate deiminase [Celerinatantimonas diazotrophica]|uniref:Formimidoylglutamate deiminase n=1 Tax=Celerinatantimonas diazotrophica TaxID=412034 RepID=A0A4R1J9A9_9GAMM|nr:formimidoylglutamate deiminase [Celerinatantimonas diazotrophica]TCK47090.1 formimidoylglutamate deiminase [Celerinatantimonas diazotrophica]CAG9295859.1 8-oxoguanine deaminase [Celerinatantimonas diazotrophica]
MERYLAPFAYLPSGWQRNVCIEIDDNGFITQLTANDVSGQCQKLTGAILPGMPNLHSHAFQRAMAGLGEQRLNPHDSFWSWREQMYQVALQITPEQLYVIAKSLYMEMLEGGFTSVGEFHYLHHDANGKPYAGNDEMADAISRAAADAGIGLTLLPTLYSYSDFAMAPASSTQRRFIQTTEQYLAQLDRLKPLIQARPNQRLGGCFHSLRACTPEQINDVVATLPSDWPLHLHLSEQMREVNRCLEVHQTTPLDWLSRSVEINARWCMIHATHITTRELELLANAQAVAGLCPLTEASLGDGLFEVKRFLAKGGRIGIGSDSHISVDVSEELRMLEYGQRLKHQQRNFLANTQYPSTAERMLVESYRGGAQALAQPIGQLAVGQRADLIELDLSAPYLESANIEQLLDSWVFAHYKNAIQSVMVAGKWQVKEHQHLEHQSMHTHLLDTLTALRS